MHACVRTEGRLAGYCSRHPVFMSWIIVHTIAAVVPVSRAMARSQIIVTVTNSVLPFCDHKVFQ